MVGRLYNAADGWMISYKFEQNASSKFVPLHPHDVNESEGFNWDLIKKEGSEVEFTFVREFSHKENREVEYGKLVVQNPTPQEPEQEVEETHPSSTPQFLPAYNWDDVFELWYKHQSYSKTIDGLQEFLEKNYLPPYKK